MRRDLVDVLVSYCFPFTKGAVRLQHPYYDSPTGTAGRGCSTQADYWLRTQKPEFDEYLELKLHTLRNLSAACAIWTLARWTLDAGRCPLFNGEFPIRIPVDLF